MSTITNQPLKRFNGEWETKQLDQISDCLDNVRVPLNEAQRAGMPGPYPYCGANGVLDHVNDFVIDDDVILMAEDGGHFDEYAYRPIAYRMKGKIWVNNHAHVLKAKVDYDQGFLYYSLVHKDILPYLSGGTRAKLNRFEMNKIKINLPQETDEQRAIAEVLSDMDGLLNALETLIAKKQAIKQATMQQLLTAKTRLPGFSRTWETKQLGELGPFVKGRGIKRDDVSYEGLPGIRYGELYTRYQDYIFKVTSRIPPNVAATALPIKTGDLLFAGSGETAEEIGRCAAYVGKEQAYAGGDIIVLTPSGQNSIYLGHLMNHPIVAEQKARLGQGDAVVHISANNLAQVQIELPPITEQNAIASVLSDMDAEIRTLEQRRDKTRAIKHGMMQQLLTGRVRLSK